jgi:DNA-binding NarL/FixJ family response regulator
MLLRGLEMTFAELPGIDLVAAVTSVQDLLAGPGRNADVVLLDLDLGDGSSPPDTISQLGDLGLAVAVYSASADPATVRSAIRAGALAYVAKTDQPEDVAIAIRATADRSGWLSPPLAFLLLTDDAPDRPELSPRETEALRLYAAGLSMKLVAGRMGVTQETAKQYVDRVRKKYRDSGRAAGNKIELRQRAVEDGIIPPA